MPAQPLGINMEHLEKECSYLGHETIGKAIQWYGLEPAEKAEQVTLLSSAIGNRFCGMPDFADRDNASWPRSCMQRNFAYEFSNRINLSTSQVGQSVSSALEVLNGMSAATMALSGSVQDAHIWAKDGPLSGSTLAWSFLPNGSCSDRIEQRYDNSSRTWNVDMLAKVLLHEWLHAWGLEHSNNRNDIMYPSIDPNKRLSDYALPTGMPGDRARMVAFYGAHVPDPGDPPPPTPPAPGSFVSIEQYNKDRAKDRRFIETVRDAFGDYLQSPSNNNQGGGTFGL